ncbi:MAG: hypothetical protein U0521_15415 [Anaerolineae bacterium]
MKMRDWLQKTGQRLVILFEARCRRKKAY